MHKKRPRDPISAIATLLWMTAGSAKIRDGRSVFTPGLSSVATNWIDRDLANRQFSFSLVDKSPVHFSSLKSSGNAAWPELNNDDC